MKAPYVHTNKNGEIEIIGEPKGLHALGELLIKKAEMGNQIDGVFDDGVNKPIKIKSSDDFKMPSEIHYG